MDADSSRKNGSFNAPISFVHAGGVWLLRWARSSVNAALMNLTKALADRGVHDGVRVNAVNPGLILTPDWKKTAFIPIPQLFSPCPPRAEGSLFHVEHFTFPDTSEVY